MSSLLPGDRVSLAAKKGKNQNKGVLAVKNEDYYIVVLDEPLVWRESSTWERSHAEDLGVDPRQCIFVPRKEGRRIQEITGALQVYANDRHARFTEEGLRIRALLVYERYFAAQGDQRQELLEGVISHGAYPCSACSRFGPMLSMEDVAKQFAQKDKSSQSVFGRIWAILAGFFGDSHEQEAKPQQPQLDDKARLHTDCIIQTLADQGEDRDLCTVAVAQAARKARANVTEGQFLAFCYEELRSLKDVSTATDGKLGRMSSKDTLMGSSSPPPRQGEVKSAEMKHCPQPQQARPKSGSPRHRSGQPASSTLIRDARDEEKFVRRMGEFGVTDAVAIQAIAAAKTKYPKVTDEDRFLQYCLDEAMEIQVQSPPAPESEDVTTSTKPADRTSHGLKEHTSSKIDGHKGSFDDRTERQDYATRSKTKNALIAKYRAEVADKLTSMSYSFQDAYDAIDRVMARAGYLLNEPSQDEVLGELVLRCLDELRDVQPVPAEPKFERQTSQEGYTLPAAVAANVGQALASDRAVPDQPPMDIERSNSYASSYNGEERKLKMHETPPDCVTEAEVRISARCARTNSPLVEKVPKGTSYDGLRERLLQKFQQQFAEPEGADPSNYKIYLEQEDDFSVEIVPPSYGEREEATVLVTELKKDNKVNIWHVNENVGPKQPLATLASNFKFNRSMQRKVTELREAYGYEGWRRIRGDGNCYYRAVLFGYLEQVVAHPRRTELLDAFLQMVEALPYDPGSEDAESHEALLQELRAAIKETRWKTAADFRARILDPTTGIDRALVLAVRRVIGAYLLEHAQDDFNGITLADTILSSYDVADMADYVERCVLTLGEDAEGSFVYLGIMFKALGIGGRTVFLDRRDDVDLTILRTPEEEMPVNVHLLLRPGHYDLLYVGPDATAIAEAGGESKESVSSASI